MSKFCTNCGGEMEDSAKFCPKCGTAAQAEENASKPVRVITPAPAGSAKTHSQAAGTKNSANKSVHGVLSILYYIAAVAVVVCMLLYHLPRWEGTFIILLLVIAAAGGSWYVVGKVASKNVTYTKLLIWHIIAFAVSVSLLVMTKTCDVEYGFWCTISMTSMTIFSIILLVTSVYVIVQCIKEQLRAM